MASLLNKASMMSRMTQIVVITRKDGITDSNGPETDWWYRCWHFEF
ncbi:MAG: hypothetical protein ACLSIL_03830 [Enterococcus casseliflavus]